MSKTIKSTKSTYDEFVEALTQEEKEKFEREYQDLLLSEMIIAAMQQNELSVRKLAKMAGVSPTIVQEMRSGSSRNFSTRSFFKVLKGLGCKFAIERDGQYIPLDLNNFSKKS